MRGKEWPNGLGFDLTGYRYGAWVCRLSDGHSVKWDGSEGGAEFVAVLTRHGKAPRCGIANDPELAVRLARMAK